MNPEKRRAKKLAKRKASKDRDGQHQRESEAARRSSVSHTEVSILREVAYIIERAVRQDARVVVIGELVLFSTASGDAWLLDIDDRTATCLARDGVSQGVRITETPTQFVIDWEGGYSIEGDIFCIQHRSGKMSAITGYPLTEIQQAIAHHAQLAGGATRLAGFVGN